MLKQLSLTLVNPIILFCSPFPRFAPIRWQEVKRWWWSTTSSKRQQPNPLLVCAKQEAFNFRNPYSRLASRRLVSLHPRLPHFNRERQYRQLRGARACTPNINSMHVHERARRVHPTRLLRRRLSSTLHAAIFDAVPGDAR